jgi:hypothetical protein
MEKPRIFPESPGWSHPHVIEKKSSFGTGDLRKKTYPADSGFFLLLPEGVV